MIKRKYVFFSPSKLNLFLEILSKRDDGYHNLNSLMCFSNIGDKIEIKESRYFILKIQGDFAKKLCNYDENIILKAVKTLEFFLKIKIKLEIILTKNLPIASGLAGGSSNAATVIKGVLNFLKLKVKKKLLNNILVSLGADVPFCFYGKTSIVEGFGNNIKPVFPIPSQYVLLVNPLIEVSTKKIFKKLKKFTKIKTNYPTKEIKKEKFLDLLLKSKNDLEEIVKTEYPEVKAILDTFKNKTYSDFYRMSGSGATCFGFFNKKDYMEKAKSIFENQNNNYWIKEGKILNHI